MLSLDHETGREGTQDKREGDLYLRVWSMLPVIAVSSVVYCLLACLVSQFLLALRSTASPCSTRELLHRLGMFFLFLTCHVD